MSPYHATSFVIIGLTSEGRRFRPSDWAERLCGIMSVFGAERRMAYSPYVRPGSHKGEKCVFVDAHLHDIEPMAYSFIANFARDNSLQVEPWSPGKP
jgi:hypothetical protein